VSSSGGEATLSFRYANVGGGRPATVSVNGAVVGTLDFADTGDWTSWTAATITTSLSAGDNDVVLTATSDGGLANLDSLSVEGSDIAIGDCPPPVVVGDPNVFATAPGTVEVWVNGVSIGSTTSPGALLSAVGALSAGSENVVAIRATKGSAAAPALLAQLQGVFGKAGSTALWKAKAASSSDELTGSAWTQPGYGDTAWAAARDVSQSPTAAPLVGGPARGIWSASDADATALFRLHFYFPGNWDASSPLGFGRAVTGGAGGATVTVTTPAELAAAVTSSQPLTIQVQGRLDFTGLDGTSTAAVCYQSQCGDGTFELITNGLGACDSAGKSTFSYTFDAAGNQPLQVASNKTILGLGNDATIVGKGFVLRSGVSNIILRNLTITDINPELIWGGDAISLNGASDVWIDHNRISLIGRQFLVSGFDPAKNVTVSFNEFDGRTTYSAYCNGTHYWDMLILGSDDTMTLMDNWIHDMSGRSPHVGGYASVTARLHLVNDYHQRLPGHACDPGVGGYAFYEGSYFDAVTTPFTNNADGAAYAPLASTLASTNALCSTTLGRACVANEANGGTSTFRLDAAALTSFSTFTSSMITPYPAAQVPNCVPHLAGPGHL